MPQGGEGGAGARLFLSPFFGPCTAGVNEDSYFRGPVAEVLSKLRSLLSLGRAGSGSSRDLESVEGAGGELGPRMRR